MHKVQKATSILSLTVQPLILNALSIPAIAFIIRHLGAEKYGQWVFAGVLVGIAGSISNLGFRTLFIKKIAQQPEDAGRIISEQLFLRCVLSFFSLLVILVSIASITTYRDIILCVAILAINLLFTVISSIFGDALQGMQKFNAYSRITLISGLTITISSIIAVMYHPDIIYLSLSYTTGPFISMICFYNLIRKSHKVILMFNHRVIINLIKESKEISAQSGAAILQEKLEQLIIPHFTTMATFGIYSAGILPSTRLTIIPDGIGSVFYPLMSKYYKHEPSLLAKSIVDLWTIMTSICLPIAIYILFGADQIASIIFKHEKELCKIVMITTIWAIPIQGISYSMGYSLQAADKHIQISRLGIRGNIFCIILVLALVYKFGILGACLAFVTRSLVPAILMIPIFRQTFPEVLQEFKWVNILICNGILALMLVSIYHLSYNKNIFIFLISIIISALTYISTLFLFNVIKTTALKDLISFKSK